MQIHRIEFITKPEDFINNMVTVFIYFVDDSIRLSKESLDDRLAEVSELIKDHVNDIISRPYRPDKKNCVFNPSSEKKKGVSVIHPKAIRIEGVDEEKNIKAPGRFEQ